MKVRFWIDGKMIDAEVAASTDRTYLVAVVTTMFQVPKHSATPLLEAAIKERQLPIT